MNFRNVCQIFLATKSFFADVKPKTSEDLSRSYAQSMMIAEKNGISEKEIFAFILAKRKYVSGKSSKNSEILRELVENEKFAIELIYKRLRDREINPSGSFDKRGRWHADNAELISVREPSAAHPYSQMVACRSKKYVQACWEKLKKKNIFELYEIV